MGCQRQYEQGQGAGAVADLQQDLLAPGSDSGRCRAGGRQYCAVNQLGMDSVYRVPC
jgi:hypothetical protein